MLATARSSRHSRSWVLTRALELRCKKSFRWWATLAWITLSRSWAFLLFLDPFCRRAAVRSARRSARERALPRAARGASRATSVPSARAATRARVSPRSTPTKPCPEPEWRLAGCRSGASTVTQSSTRPRRRATVTWQTRARGHAGPGRRSRRSAPGVLSHRDGAQDRQGDRAGLGPPDGDARGACLRDLVAEPEGLGAAALLLEAREPRPARVVPLALSKAARARAEVDRRFLEHLGAHLVAPGETQARAVVSPLGPHHEAPPGVRRTLPGVEGVDERVGGSRHRDASDRSSSVPWRPPPSAGTGSRRTGGRPRAGRWPVAGRRSVGR